MDVSALLNAAPLEADPLKLPKLPPRLSPKRSSSSTSTRVTDDNEEESAWFKDTRGRWVDTLPVPYCCDTHAFTHSSGGQSSRVTETKGLDQSLALYGRQQLDGHDRNGREYSPAEPRRHRFSDSQSSVSSRDSMPSQPHSRTSSVTTVGDDAAASLSYVDAFHDTKLATVQEETSLRFQNRKDGQKRAGRSSRPPLAINTNPSSGRSIRQRRYAKTSSISGAKSSGGLTGCTLLPPACGSSTLERPDLRGPARHIRTISAPGSSSQEYRTSTSLSSDLRQLNLPTMNQAHARDESRDGLDDVPVHISRPNTPHDSEAPPATAPREPGTPQSSFSFVQVTTPQSATSAESPYVNSASTTDAVLSYRPSALGTPTRQTRARTNTQTSIASDVDLDQPCFAQEGCMESSVSRKAISHFFGRNKKCTLLIPAHVWISICRKHYQRTRYRNADRYAMYQVDLIRKQIEKIDRWEKTFRDKGQPSPIKGWTIALRKRQNQGASAASALPVPAWIQGSAGSGYSTDDIRGVAARIEQELEQNLYKDIPEIEFLPNITSGTVKSPTRRATKSHVRRTSRASSVSSSVYGTHSRSSSLTVNTGRPSPAKPQEGPENPYYQAARLNIQRSAERANQDLRFFTAEQQAAAEHGDPLLRFPSDSRDYHRREDGLVVHSKSGKPLMGNAGVNESVLHQAGASTGPTNSGYRVKGEFAAFEEPNHPQGESHPMAGYEAYNPEGHAFADRLPSFTSGFGSAWGTRARGGSSGFDSSGHGQPAHGFSQDIAPYQPASTIAHVEGQVAARNSFAAHASPSTGFDAHGSLMPAPTPYASDARMGYHTMPYREIHGLYELPSPDNVSGYHATDQTPFPYLAVPTDRQATATSQASPAYASPYLPGSTGHEHESPAHETVRVAPSSQYRQRPVFQYGPWAAATHTSVPQSTASNLDANVPEADMNGNSGAQK